MFILISANLQAGENRLRSAASIESTTDCKSATLHNCASLGRGPLFYQLLKNGRSLDEMDIEGKRIVHYFELGGQRAVLSKFITYANWKDGHDYIKKCIEQSYALFLPSNEEIKEARYRMFDLLRTLQGKLKLPPYVVLEILKYDDSRNKDLTILLVHELEIGNPCGSLVLLNMKHILPDYLREKVRMFFLKALTNVRCPEFSAKVCDLRQDKKDSEDSRFLLDYAWLKKNLNILIKKGIDERFKQLSDHRKRFDSNACPVQNKEKADDV